MSPKGQANCVATLLAPKGFSVNPIAVERCKDFLKTCGIEHLDVQMPHNDQVELIFKGDLAKASQAIYAADRSDQNLDVIVQPQSNRRKKLLIADMESTIIEQEMLDELADVIGRRDEVAALTRRAMNGEIDFATALRERVSMLKGQPVSVLDEVAKRITLMPGAKELLKAMKEEGATTLLVSGGFTYFVDKVASELGFDHCSANRLEIKDDRLTGEVLEPILDKESKKLLLERACAAAKLDIADALAIGDGANDIPMLALCNEKGGMGIAYHAKPNVRKQIPHQLNHRDLTALIDIQGLSRDR